MKSKMFAGLEAYIREIAGGLELLGSERRAILESAVDFIRGKLAASDSADLIFICTHNSRRSHIAQAWCQVAAHHYQVEALHAFSGGTEATACNIRTIEALRRTGLQIEEQEAGENPVYAARYARDRDPIWLYSKIYDTGENPQSGYGGMMCCSDVDENCPVIRGADVRIPLHYRDPKEADGTPAEIETYDQRCREIATEMFYMVSRLNR